ncbi:MAG: hypothetical protein JRI23_32715 [Deltaproteobacteria bacterium]|jgi:nitrogenase molybdenum-iron protein alpha/beta subunit|nr:hypothetical protein [Deltaproteobacteria bacterium]MBW2537015.1 hypothetical protein [Deltaproteobacteria bacterium]
MTTETSGNGAPDRSPSDDRSAPDITALSEAHQIFNHTYLSGVFFLLNAVPDIRLLFDGPSCGYDKAFLVSGTHDLFSRTFRFPARHRITCTHVQADALVHDREQTILHVLEQVASADDAKLVLVAAMPMASITGIDYEGIVSRAKSASTTPVAVVAEKSFRNDWLVGFDDALCTLADQLVKAPSGGASREDVAVVGYFLDRNEGDHVGNVAELRRVAEALGLRLVSTWLDGSPTRELARIARAGTIISLPYGRRAAKQIADKTGAQLVELDLPVGLRASREWVGALGAATGRRWEAKQFVAAELASAVPILDVAVADYLQGRRFAFNGDPFVGEAVIAAYEELGCTAAHAVIFGVKEACERLVAKRRLDEVPTRYCARMSEILELDWADVDFVVGNSYVHYLVRLRDARKAYVELGFPSYRYHCFTHSPSWFFRGFVHLTNRVINEL